MLVMAESQKYAIVFPGQGSQSPNMLSGWKEQQDIVDEVLGQAQVALGYDLAEVIASDNGHLNQTHITQPAMLAAGVVAWRIWQRYCKQAGVGQPSDLAGHSLGEYTALVASGVLTFSDALRLVEYRGQCMQEAVAEGVGAMAAIIGLDDDTVIENCKLAATEGVVEAVNFNAPGQVVIAGEKKAVAAAIDLLKQAGARRALPLPVSVPSHCQLMIPAAKKLETYLDSVDFCASSIPVTHNVNAKNLQVESDIKAILVEQLYKPVRWVECMQAIANNGVSMMIECGPAKVLSGLQRRIDKSITTHALFDDESLQKIIELSN